MIASLPMYARPELDAPNRRLWDAIRDHLTAAGINAPAHLENDGDVMDTWTDPDLVLGQTCGMPYRLFLHGKVRLVGTPDHGLPGCPPGYYRSAIVVRREDTRTTLTEFAAARFAYNEEHSQSGYAAPLCHAERHGVCFPDRVMSRGHRVSARMVADGEADIAGLDAVTWELLQRYDAFANRLRVLAMTAPPTPALPFITSLGHDADMVHAALDGAIREVSVEDRDALMLRGIVKIGAEDYLAIPNPGDR